MSALAVAPAPLTARQRQVLDFLYSFTLEHGYQPSAREVLDRFGIGSTNSYVFHVRTLARKGYVRLAQSRARGVVFLAWPDGAPFRGLARPGPESVAGSAGKEGGFYSVTTPESHP